MTFFTETLFREFEDYICDRVFEVYVRLNLYVQTVDFDKEKITVTVINFRFYKVTVFKVPRKRCPVPVIAKSQNFLGWKNVNLTSSRNKVFSSFFFVF